MNLSLFDILNLLRKKNIMMNKIKKTKEKFEVND